MSYNRIKVGRDRPYPREELLVFHIELNNFRPRGDTEEFLEEDLVASLQVLQFIELAYRDQRLSLTFS
jgi:hypothetical protein